MISRKVGGARPLKKNTRGSSNSSRSPRCAQGVEAQARRRGPRARPELRRGPRTGRRRRERAGVAREPATSLGGERESAAPGSAPTGRAIPPVDVTRAAARGGEPRGPVRGEATSVRLDVEVPDLPGRVDVPDAKPGRTRCRRPGRPRAARLRAERDDRPRAAGSALSSRWHEASVNHIVPSVARSHRAQGCRSAAPGHRRARSSCADRVDAREPPPDQRRPHRLPSGPVTNPWLIRWYSPPNGRSW